MGNGMLCFFMGFVGLVLQRSGWFERIKTGIGGKLVGMFMFLAFSGLIIWWFILQLVHLAALLHWHLFDLAFNICPPL